MATGHYVDLLVDLPNLRLIRTGLAENCLVLSESEAYSDRISRKSPCLVRIRGLFGQLKRNFAFDCPNERFILTGLAGRCLVLSESKAYSDRISRKLPCLAESRAYSDWTCRKLPLIVRMQRLFGQDKRNFPFDSPNPRLIGTDMQDV